MRKLNKFVISPALTIIVVEIRKHPRIDCIPLNLTFTMLTAGWIFPRKMSDVVQPKQEEALISLVQYRQRRRRGRAIETEVKKKSERTDIHSTESSLVLTWETNILSAGGWCFSLDSSQAGSSSHVADVVSWMGESWKVVSFRNSANIDC